MTNMPVFTRFRLWRLSREARPSRAFVSRLETVLREEIGISFWWISLKRFLVSATSAFLLLGAMTCVYAYTSDDVLPNHPLYALRQTVEHVELSTSITAARREVVLRKNKLRHYQELKRLQSHR